MELKVNFILFFALLSLTQANKGDSGHAEHYMRIKYKIIELMGRTKACRIIAYWNYLSSRSPSEKKQIYDGQLAILKRILAGVTAVWDEVARSHFSKIQIKRLQLLLELLFEKIAELQAEILVLENSHLHEKKKIKSDFQNNFDPTEMPKEKLNKISTHTKFAIQIMLEWIEMEDKVINFLEVVIYEKSCPKQLKQRTVYGIQMIIKRLKFIAKDIRKDRTMSLLQKLELTHLGFSKETYGSKEIRRISQIKSDEESQAMLKKHNSSKMSLSKAS